MPSIAQAEYNKLSIENHIFSEGSAFICCKRREILCGTDRE